jgi:hypothetical protein
VLETCHDLDLFRCCNQEQNVKNLKKIADALEAGEDGEDARDQLAKWAEGAIRDTGDRLEWRPTQPDRPPEGYCPTVFPACSTDPVKCYATILQTMGMELGVRTLERSAFKWYYRNTMVPLPSVDALYAVVRTLVEQYCKAKNIDAERGIEFCEQIEMELAGYKEEPETTAVLAAEKAPDTPTVAAAKPTGGAWKPSGKWSAKKKVAESGGAAAVVAPVVAPDPHAAAPEASSSALSGAAPPTTTLTVAMAAQLMWTSAKKIKDTNTQLCSIINDTIRLDHTTRAKAAAIFSRAVNSTIVIRETTENLPFPAHGLTFRGGCLPSKFKPFFNEGVQYRIPGFLATSDSQAVAKKFAEMAYKENFSGAQTESSSLDGAVIWTIEMDPKGAGNLDLRCRQASFIKHTLVKDEKEYLFAPYSVFTVRSVTWSDNPTYETPHEIKLTAALDNLLESEDLPLAEWY